jgi:hypothetical protein
VDQVAESLESTDESALDGLMLILVEITAQLAIDVGVAQEVVALADQFRR